MNKLRKSGSKPRAEFRPVSEDDVKLIKAMYAAGIGPSIIMKATGRGAGTVVTIIKSDGTLKDYQRLAAEKNKKYNAPKKSEVATIQVFDEVAEAPIPTNPSTLRELSKEIVGLRNKLDHVTETLDWIAENAVIETKRKRFF